MISRRFIVPVQALVVLIAATIGHWSPVEARGDAPKIASYCGLTPYDITNETLIKHGIDRNNLKQLREFRRHFVPREFRLQQDDQEQNGSNEISPPEELVAQRRRQGALPIEVPVRLRILYDSSVEERYAASPGVENFLRNLLLNVQLIFEQPELTSVIRIQLVVVGLSKLNKEFTTNDTVDLFIWNLHEYNANVGPGYDLTVLVMRRSIYERSKPSYTDGQLTGMAQPACFCDAGRPKGGAVVSALGFANQITIAHELAHNLGVPHDSTLEASECDDRKYVMSQTESGLWVRWSGCSARLMRDHMFKSYIRDCALDPRRIAASVPFNQRFDWRTPTSPGRVPLPGVEVSLDEQCQIATDKGAVADLDIFRYGNSMDRVEVCEVLHCVIDKNSFRIGPALTGSPCKTRFSSLQGICLDGVCAKGMEMRD